MGNLGHKLVIR